MIKFEYKKPRAHSGELRTLITFYEYVPNEGPMPGESKKNVLYECWAKVDQVWSKDIETAKANGTLSDLTITIRDPRQSYRPSNKHYIEIDDFDFDGVHYNIKHVQPDLQSHDFIKVIAGVKT